MNLTHLHPSRRVLPLVLLGMTAGLVACGGSGSDDEVAEDAPRWNVLLVTLDTTRPDWLGCYGGQAKTPFIDQVAEEGTRFERAVSTAGITPMSHASILTGLNNYEHGMRVFYSDEVSHTLKEEVDSLPEILKARRGYSTAAMLSAYVVSEIYNLQQGFDTYLHGIDLSNIKAESQSKHETFFDRSGLATGQRRGDFTTGDALGWLEERKGEDQPWMMWMHLFDVHDYSLVPPEDFIQAFGTKVPAMTHKAPKGKRSHQLRNDLYGMEMAWMDAQLGRVLTWLRENGEYENTIVVLTADHGQGLLDGLERHGWAKHRLLYEWGIRVPLIIKIPGQPGRNVVEAQVRTIDIVPTILEALDVAATKKMNGESLMGLMHGEADANPRLAYADALNLYDAHSPAAGRLPEGQHDNLYAVSDGQWKLVWRAVDSAKGELFDLSADPGEVQNLFSMDHPEVKRLKAFLDEQDAWRIDKPREGEGSAADADVLSGMGYTGADGDEEEDE
jgi:arylsulfatase A-like enzyme